VRKRGNEISVRRRLGKRNLSEKIVEIVTYVTISTV